MHIFQLESLHLGLLLFFAPLEVQFLDYFVKRPNKLQFVLDAACQLLFVLFLGQGILVCLVADLFHGLRLFKDFSPFLLNAMVALDLVMVLLLHFAHADFYLLGFVFTVVYILCERFFMQKQLLFLVAFLLDSSLVESNLFRWLL